MPGLLDEQNPKVLLEKVQADSIINQQLVGRFKLRGVGIKKLLGSIDLDIIAQKPHFLYLSIDSFFKQPARIVTYDGSKLYGLEEEQLEAILTLPVGPEELIEILLRGAHINPKSIQKLALDHDELQIFYRSGNLLTFTLTQEYHIQKRELRDSCNQLIYSVIYDDFPKRFYLEATYKNRKHSMNLTSQDVKLNPGLFDEQLFRRSSQR